MAIARDKVRAGDCVRVRAEGWFKEGTRARAKVRAG